MPTIAQEDASSIPEKDIFVEEESSLPQVFHQRAKEYNTFIRIYSKGPLYVYLNGKSILAVSTPPTKEALKRIRLNLEEGDVIALSAYKSIRDGKRLFGILMDINYKGVHHFTGNSFAIKAEPLVRPINRFTKFPSKEYKACFWGKPEYFPMTPKFNFPRRASYVWRRHRGKIAARVLFRFVVGGEKCKGLSYCKCRPVPNVKGYCFKMLRKRATLGRCKRERCRDKFECVPTGGRGLPTCVARYAIFRVVKKFMKDGKRFCKKIKLYPPAKFWVPYSE